MDRFYLENAARYLTLIKKLNAGHELQTIKAEADIANPDMVVSARIRPMPDDDVAAGFPAAIFPRFLDSGIVDIHDLYNSPRGKPVLKSSNYRVDKIFDSRTTTEEIYHNLVVDLVPFAWNGGIGTLFAYGQTGSGKTFTVSRIEQLVAESLMDGNLEGQRKIYITIIELAGNAAYDLLNSRKPISILEDSFGAMQLSGANEHLVQKRQDMLDLVDRAASYRLTAPTAKNDASSRSHAICRIRMEDPSTDSYDGYLYLVDLAGSEAARDVAVHGADRMRETREVNMSLSVLKDCIHGRAQLDALKFSGTQKPKDRTPRVPFRQSSLTKVLKHVFDPSTSRACKTVVIACINPSIADVSPTKNTLRYAELLRVPIPATAKAELDPTAPMTWSNAQLRDWISKNSGSPSISAAVLAPTESGSRLLALPAEEFERRCLRSAGVSTEQAKAFYSKLWQLHLDSRRVAEASGTQTPIRSLSLEPGSVLGLSGFKGKWFSCSPNLCVMKVPFKERIRPGMVVGWRQPPGSPVAVDIQDDCRIAVVLCPVDATPGIIEGFIANVVNPEGVEDAASKNKNTNGVARYLCALMKPGLMPNAYELILWKQIVLNTEMMDREVRMEYDSATRYYHLSV